MMSWRIDGLLSHSPHQWDMRTDRMRRPSKTALFEAAKALDLSELQRLLREAPGLATATDRDGRTLLHLACMAQPRRSGIRLGTQVHVVKYLLSLGLAIDSHGAKTCALRCSNRRHARATRSS
jgi:hypothetical protein